MFPFSERCGKLALALLVTAAMLAPQVLAETGAPGPEAAGSSPGSGAGETTGDGAPAPSDPSGQTTPWTVLERRPGEGEQCLVCGQRIYGSEVVELRYKGRTFHTAGGMLSDFEAAPEIYFHKLQARAGLFDEEAVPERAMPWGWLILGLVVLDGLVMGALCSYLAVTRALPPVPWFFAGLVGNVFGLVALLVVRPGDPGRHPAGVPGGLAKVPLTRAPRACPACGAGNHPAAAGCSACGATLVPTAEPETARI